MVLFFVSLVFFVFFSLFLPTGDKVEVQYKSGDDRTPVFESDVFYYNGFTGFRI